MAELNDLKDVAKRTMRNVYKADLPKDEYGKFLAARGQHPDQSAIDAGVSAYNGLAQAIDNAPNEQALISVMKPVLDARADGDNYRAMFGKDLPIP